MSPTQLPPAQPAFILRGHAAEIHAVHFTPNNARLLTGDADGWVISWNLAYKRPVAVWKAHSNSILGLGSWGSDRIITHGRDHQLLVWQLTPADETTMSKNPPAEIETKPLSNSDPSPRKQPWLLHELPVNALNFCSFAMCYDTLPHPPRPPPSQSSLQLQSPSSPSPPQPILITVPNTVSSSAIDIYTLPHRHRAATIPPSRTLTTGIVMALSIHTSQARLLICAGYESGHTLVYLQSDPAAPFETLYTARPHTQPILSLALSPCKEHYVTTGADAVVAVHPLPVAKSIWGTEMKPLKIVATKHAGQQGVSYRDDGKVLATAGWDARVRVYSRKSMREVAVLKWHSKGVGCMAFASVATPEETWIEERRGAEEVEEEGGRDGEKDGDRDGDRDGNEKGEGEEEVRTNEVIKQEGDLTEVVGVGGSSAVQRRREEKARTTHWLAAGGKDEKVSLWDIY